MICSKIRLLFKYCWLKILRVARIFLHKLPTFFSYFFLVFSVIACLIFLIPECFDRVPVLSYYIREQELPITYTLNGKVKVLDADGKTINKNIEVFVGGYSVYLKSEDFSLMFSSPITDEVYVIIRYEINGDVRFITENLKIEDNSYSITKEFIIYA